MRNCFLMLLCMLILGSCSFHTVDNKFYHEFPNQWYGYYEKVSTGEVFDALQRKFKVEKDYMLTKDETSHHDSDGFLIYKIRTIENNTINKFKFSIQGAYVGQYDPIGYYTFEKINSSQVEVTYRVGGIIFGASDSAIYNWIPL